MRIKTRSALVATVIALTAAADARAQSAPIFDTQLEAQAPLEFALPSKDPALYYPDRAQRMNIGGRVMLDCMADAQGVLRDCALVNETPKDWDFGVAALKMARAGVIHKIPTTAGGGRVAVPVTFEPEVSRRRAGVRRLVGGSPAAARRVKTGETIVAFPFAFNRTAVLKADAPYSPGGKPLLAAGAHGFYAGAFATPGQTIGVDIWCFPYAKPPLEYLCAIPYSDKSGGVVNARTPFSFTNLTFTRLHLASFVFDEEPVAIQGDLRLEYRFKRWTKTEARIEEWVSGVKGETWFVPRSPDGRARLTTLAGTYILTPVPDAPDVADIAAP